MSLPMMKQTDSHCRICGVPNTKEVNAELRDIYDRIRDGRSTYEPLVFTSDWLQENVYDEESHEATMLAMERDMVNRGLCPGCARPDLSRVDPDDIMTEEEAQDMHEYWAEVQAERRAGC